MELGDDDRLRAWKPAFGGQLVAAITATSPVQLVTVRAGMLDRFAPRDFTATVEERVAPARSRVTLLARTRDDDLDVLAAATRVVASRWSSSAIRTPRVIR